MIRGPRGPHRATLDRAENVEDLLAAGVPPMEVAHRVGASREALWRWFYRNGRPDLARIFQRRNAL
ncbi:hypothetical protein GCM10027591_03700 [Zhihengliuella somnathii]